MKIRPWVHVRMPTFQFTDHEAARSSPGSQRKGDAAQFDTTVFAAPSPQNVAIGREVFAMLRCAAVPFDGYAGRIRPIRRCRMSPTRTSLAPNLTLARVRLRHDWIADWIRRPDEMIPGTRMPTNFPRDAETGGFQSPLAHGHRHAGLRRAQGRAAAALQERGSAEQDHGRRRRAHRIIFAITSGASASNACALPARRRRRP